MGKYINENSKGQPLPAQWKEAALIDDGAILTDGKEFCENLVCVMDNGPFEAAAYMYLQSEWEYFKRDDGRMKTWFIYPHAEKLAK